LKGIEYNHSKKFEKTVCFLLLSQMQMAINQAWFHSIHVHIGYGENELREHIKQAGGFWNATKKQGYSPTAESLISGWKSGYWMIS